MHLLQNFLDRGMMPRHCRTALARMLSKQSQMTIGYVLTFAVIKTFDLSSDGKSNLSNDGSGEPGLVDSMLALHAGSRGFDSHQGLMSERFFRSNRPGYSHPVSSELENSGIRVAVGDCSVTERRRWRPPYQTGKTVHIHAKHFRHNEDGRTAPGACGNGFVPLSHSENVVTRIGIHTHSNDGTESRHNAFLTSASLNKTASAFHLFRCLFAIKSADNA